ncbi:glutamate receptor 3-like [Neocloeon triangulifer]|uniref:glutamate receptor 3-like n=1 Tax=Neocloeon triangulifer TaxID=2078957 RepID=UPI00286F4B7B|nr:glutamate receptor 3-like [Neocloeon triangulifer]
MFSIRAFALANLLALVVTSKEHSPSKPGLKLVPRPKYTVEVMQGIGTINLKSFSNSYCLHPIYDPENAANIFQRGSGLIPHITTEDGCPNIIIWFQNLSHIVHILATRNLPREGKYIIFTSTPDTNGTLQQVVEKEMYLDVKLSVLKYDSVSKPKQLGIAVGENGRVNLQGRMLQVVGLKNPPFTVYTEKKSVRGVEMRVVRELAEALNFRWEFHEPLDGQLWGHFDRRKRAWTGLKGELAYGKADIGVAMLYLAQDHYEAFQLSSPYTMVCLTFLVPAPKRILGNWDALLKPLRPFTWVSFAIIAVIYTSLYYAAAARKKSIVFCVLQTIQLAAQISGPQPSRRTSQRILFFTWIVGCFFVANLYNSELSAWMVAQVTATPLRTIRDMAHSKVTWGRLDTDMFIYLQQSDSDLGKKLARKFKLAKTEADVEENVKKGGYGVFVHVLSDGYPSGAEYLSSPARRSLVTLPDCMATRFVSIGMRRGLPLQRATSVELRRLQEAGLLQEWQARDVRKYGDQADYRSYAGSQKPLHAPLAVDNLAGAFAFLAIGLNLAAVPLR